MGSDFQPLSVDWIFTTAKDTATLKALLPVRHEAKASKLVLRNQEIEEKEKELADVRREHFSARTPATKRKYRDLDKSLRLEIADLLSKNHALEDAAAQQLANWDPYNQNAHADFFDPEWMFGVEGGFDVVIGNPPYLRVQSLEVGLKEYLGHNYLSAVSSYDLYVIFVEKGLRLLSKEGELAYILPHKFFQAKYGEGLRKIISAGKHLKKIVNFGDSQVFDGASNYTCLLFLAKEKSQEFSYTPVKDVRAWLETNNTEEGKISNVNLSSKEWNFSLGKNALLLEKLNRFPIRLENVTSRIFQGFKTSADKIYIVEEVDRNENKVKIFSRQTEKEYWVESELFHPLVKGGDSRRYNLSMTNRLILFPYKIEDGKDTLIPATNLGKEFPLTWDYLIENKEYLEDREDGKFHNSEWFQYGRNQALDVMHLPKLFTPDIALHSSFSYDETGNYYFTGGVAGGYGVLPLEGYSEKYILGLLNSKLLEWYIKNTATTMQGGYFSYRSRFIRSLPIVNTNSIEKNRIIALVTQILAAKRVNPAAETKDLEREIDQLVYALYGLTDEEKAIVEGQA